MAWLHEAGVPVPRVDGCPEPGAIAMEFIRGRSMFEALAAAPHTALRHARTLADLQRSVNQLRAPDWFPSAGSPTGASVLHLDLHPMNVIYGVHGPVIIDWTNVARGPAELDAAMTYVLVSTFEVASRFERTAQRAFGAAFALLRGRRHVRAGLLQAIERRLGDPNTTPAERQAVARLGPTRRRPDP